MAIYDEKRLDLLEYNCLVRPPHHFMQFRPLVRLSEQFDEDSVDDLHTSGE
jgi:hypothetical protein